MSARGPGADVHVVGAGLIGLAVADALAARGAQVTVWDRDEPARAASWAGAGMLAPFSEDAGDPALHALCVASYEAYPAFVDDLRERTGVDSRLRRDGTLHVALDDGAAQALDARAAAFARAGGIVERVDRRAALAREPLLSPAVRSAVFVANESQVDNRRLGRALTAACEHAGVRFERVAHLALEADPRRVRGLVTERGFTPATTVVNAGGAWAGSLAGLPAHAAVAVRPIAGEMIALAIPRGAMTSLVWSGHRYLVPRDDGRLLVGATVVDRGFDARVTAGGVADLLGAALAIAPALGAFALVESWAGLRPGSHDGRPYLGAAGLDGYLVAAGHYRNGILLAPITAAFIAATLAGEATPVDATPFLPLRGRSTAATA